MSDTTIENLTAKPLWLRLNSGAALSILPGSSREVPAGEVLGNAKLAKLHDDGVIRTEPPYGDAEATKAAQEKAAQAKAGAAKKKAVQAARRTSRSDDARTDDA